MEIESKLLDMGMKYGQVAVDWIKANILVLENIPQILVLLIAILVGRIVRAPLHRFFDKYINRERTSQTLRSLLYVLKSQASNVVMLAFIWIFFAILSVIQMKVYLLLIVAKLMLAWVGINLLLWLSPNRTWGKFLALCVWILTALSVIGLLKPTVDILSAQTFKLGAISISAYIIIKSLFWLVILMMGANSLGKIIEQRLKRSEQLSPSIQVVFSQFVKILLVLIVLAFTMTSLGIDLTALAVFSGAIAVGIGLGLQKTAANLMSGFGLLLDKSIKPGDVIELGDTFGWVNTITGRYTSITANDGREYIIPNDKLASEQVINWSFNGNNVRLRLNFSINTKSDVKKAIEFAEAGTLSVARVLKSPKPTCHMESFKTGAIDLVLLFWIKDPKTGIESVKGDVLMKVWSLFDENNIDLPAAATPTVYIREMKEPQQSIDKPKTPKN